MLRLNFIFLFFSAVVLSAEIIETPHFRNLQNYITPETLVILDIDDTLLVPVQTLGSDVWFQYQLAKNSKEAPDQDPLDRTLALWEAIRHMSRMQTVEEGSEELVKQMQDEKIAVMGLTTQGLALTTRTIQQLQSLHFDLSKTAPSSEDLYFMNGHGVLYRKGILFTAGTNKGKALAKFLDFAGYSPKRIVFVNDKRTHLEQVEKVMEERNIPFIGLRYSYSDTRVASFRPEIAEIQLRHSAFDQIMSDLEAENILSSKSVLH